jgi:hypothetical protein
VGARDHCPYKYGAVQSFTLPRTSSAEQREDLYQTGVFPVDIPGVRSYPWVEAGRSPSVTEMVSVEAPRTTVSETLAPGA